MRAPETLASNKTGIPLYTNGLLNLRKVRNVNLINTVQSRANVVKIFKGSHLKLCPDRHQHDRAFDIQRRVTGQN